MSDVEPEAVEWLWPGCFALGKLHLIAGDGGRGKSTVTLDMAGRVSTGAAWPNGEGVAPLGDVLILSAEDDPGDTIRPRLDAAQADVTRVHCLTGVSVSDGKDRRELHITLADLRAIEEALDQFPDCRLLIIDPLAAYLGKADSHVDAEIRGLLAPLAKLAAARRIAVVIVAHLNKGAAQRAIYRISGSQGTFNACRIAWFVAEHEDDDDRRRMHPAKNNLAKPAGTIDFVLRGSDNGVAHVEWIAGREHVDLDAAMAGPVQKGTKDDAKSYLLAALANGPRPQKELENGSPVSPRTLKTAKSELGISSSRPGGTGPWFWELPKGASTPTHTVAPLHPSLEAPPDNGSKLEGKGANVLEGSVALLPDMGFTDDELAAMADAEADRG